MDAEFLVGESNQPLFLRKWAVDPGNRPAQGHRAVFLGHSQPTHSGMLHDLGAGFRQLGWNAYSGDIRGHGKSTGSQTPLGHLDYEDGWQRAVADMRLLFERSFAGIPWEHRLVVVPNITALLTLEVLKTWPDLARRLGPWPTPTSLASQLRRQDRPGIAFRRVVVGPTRVLPERWVRSLSGVPCRRILKET